MEYYYAFPTEQAYSYTTETIYVQSIKKANNVRKGTVQLIVYYYNIRYGMLGNNYYSREGRFTVRQFNLPSLEFIKLALVRLCNLYISYSIIKNKHTAICILT